MKSIKRYINLKTEALFQQALKGNKVALFIVNSSKYIAKAPYGIWLFRKGDISASLTILASIKKPSFIAKRCIERCQDINTYMQPPLPNGCMEATPKDLKAFNHKVLFTLHSNGHYHTNGYAIRTVQIIDALRANDIHVDCMTRLGYPWDLSETATQPRCTKVSYDNVDFSQTFDPNNLISGPESEYIQKYTQIIRNKATECCSSVIHAHSSYLNGIATASAAKQLNIKSCYEVRGLWHLSRAIKEPIFHQSEHFKYCEKMELLACSLVDQVFTLTNTLKSWLINNGIPADKISVVPNGAPLQALQKQQENKKNENEQMLTLGFIGSITQYEGLDTVLKALALLENNNIKLVIAGTGLHLKHLKKLTNKLKLAHQVTFLGKIPREEVEHLYSQTDVIMVNRSESELTQLVSPIKHIEAFSYGVPCIVSNLPALTEAAQNGKNCLTVTPNSETETAKAITLLYQDRKLLNKLTKGTSAILTSYFNWENIAKTYTNSYNQPSS